MDILKTQAFDCQLFCLDVIILFENLDTGRKIVLE